VPVASTVADAVAAFRTVVLTARAESLVGAQSAERLLAAADEVAAAQDRGKGKPADKRARELTDLVARLASDGSIEAAAVGPVSAAAAQISDLVAASR
jgi:hypothetical protein